MTLVVYHRCGGKSLGYPPNTILTAKWASERGAKAIEYDVVLGQDDPEHQIFVIEPKVLKAAGFDINNVQWSEVKNLNAGNEGFGPQKVPLLEEMLEAIDNSKTAHQIHLKGTHPATVATLLPKVAHLSNYLFTAFDISVIKEVKSLSPSAPVGWLVKQSQEGGDEGGADLTAKLAEGGSIKAYSDSEISEIIEIAKASNVDVVLLCGPRIKSKEMVERVRKAGLGVGAWGVAQNLELAKRLIAYGLDRLTLDNPEQLTAAEK